MPSSKPRPPPNGVSSPEIFPAFRALTTSATPRSSTRTAFRARLDRVVMGTDPELGLDTLLFNGALAAILPEVHAMVGFGDGEWRHKDVWKHTKQVVRQARAAARGPLGGALPRHREGEDAIDQPRRQGPLPRPRRGRAPACSRSSIGASSSSRPEPALKETVRFLILHHLRANQYEESWTDSAVRRFAREIGEHLDDLLCLSRADITTKRPEKKRRGLSQIEELAARIQKLAEEDAQVPPLPVRGRGRDHEGIRPQAVAPHR